MKKMLNEKTGERVSVVCRLNFVQTRVINDAGDVSTVNHEDLVPAADLFDGTAYADDMSVFERVALAHEQKRVCGAPDLSDLPFFSENEQEARATVQLSAL